MSDSRVPPMGGKAAAFKVRLTKFWITPADTEGTEFVVRLQSNASGHMNAHDFHVGRDELMVMLVGIQKFQVEYGIRIPPNLRPPPKKPNLKSVQDD